jgi:hypothetical protein
MPQVVPGLLLGEGVYVLRGDGDPNARTTGFLTRPGIAVGSVFLSRAGVTYQKTGEISAAAPAGVWRALKFA